MSPYTDWLVMERPAARRRTVRIGGGLAFARVLCGAESQRWEPGEETLPAALLGGRRRCAWALYRC